MTNCQGRYKPVKKGNREWVHRVPRHTGFLDTSEIPAGRGLSLREQNDRKERDLCQPLMHSFTYPLSTFVFETD